MLKIFEDFYKRGYEAGVTAQKLEQREDFERRLTEMYHFGNPQARRIHGCKDCPVHKIFCNV